MAIDDEIGALRKELENVGDSDSVNKTVLSLLSSLPLPWPFNVSVNKVKERIHAEEHERIRVVLTTVVEILGRHRETLDEIRQKQSQTEHVARTEAFLQLLLDGARKASVTRSMERVKRIGLILANGFAEPKPINEDEIEELMRVARELTDLDVVYLRELVEMEGGVVRIKGRVERYEAYRRWDDHRWLTSKLGEIESTFNKLEGYGLVSKIPPPNNINIMADMPNSYVLLPKGLRFVDLIAQKATD
jgi:hypothetical protein